MCDCSESVQPLSRHTLKIHSQDILSRYTPWGSAPPPLCTLTPVSVPSRPHTTTLPSRPHPHSLTLTSSHTLHLHPHLSSSQYSSTSRTRVPHNHHHHPTTIITLTLPVLVNAEDKGSSSLELLTYLLTYLVLVNAEDKGTSSLEFHNARSSLNRQEWRCRSEPSTLTLTP